MRGEGGDGALPAKDMAFYIHMPAVTQTDLFNTHEPEGKHRDIY